MTAPNQFRTMMIYYQNYRAQVREMIIQSVKKPSARVTLALVGTLALLTVLGLLVLRPTLVTISRLISEIREENRLITLLDARIGSLQTAARLLSQLEPQLPLLAAAIPPRPELEVFIKEVELLAQKNQLTSLEISQPGFTLVGSKTETTLPLTINAGGSESAIRQLTADLNQIDRLVIFRRVNLSAVPPEDRDSQPYPVQGTITLDIIFLKEAANQ